MIRAKPVPPLTSFLFLCACALGSIGLGVPAVAGAGGLTVVPTDHGRPPLRVKAWANRGPEAIYYPGEAVEIRFTTNDHAYVVVYDIDTEGHVRQLFPAPGDPGFVHAREVVTLPGHGAHFDYVVTGPAGIETIEVVASRAPLHPWESAIEGPWDEYDGYEYEDHDYDHDDEEYEYYEDDDHQGEDWDGDGYDDGEDLEGGPWGEDAYRGHGFIGAQVSGDPFVAIGSLNRRLVPVGCEARDYDTAYLTFYVEQHVSYPRYACNDCHGVVHGYDPYIDHCSVFSVGINFGWVYPSHHVHVVHEHVLGPRYVYVRHEEVPVRYKNLKRKWTGHDRKSIDRELKPLLVASHKKKGYPGGKVVPSPTKRAWPGVKSGSSKPSKPNPDVAIGDWKRKPPSGNAKPEYRAPKRSGGDAPSSKPRGSEYRVPKRSSSDVPRSKSRSDYRVPKPRGGSGAKIEPQREAAARWEAPPPSKGKGQERAAKGKSPPGKGGGGKDGGGGKSSGKGKASGGGGGEGKAASKRR